jgi:hypothetical protein
MHIFRSAACAAAKARSVTGACDRALEKEMRYVKQ